jgi:hypothetical protein
MQTRIAAVYPGVPTVVDAVVAGVQVQAEWVGAPPAVGELVDVELDIDAVLEWADGVAPAPAAARIAAWSGARVPAWATLR